VILGQRRPWPVPQVPEGAVALEHELTHLVTDFVRRVAELAQSAVLESMRTALGPRGPQRLPRNDSPSLKARAARRTNEDLRVVERALVAFVEKHPGLRVEQISKALGTETRELTLPIRKLVASGALRSQGQKRATRYFALTLGGN
jgi:Fic family protein